MTMHNIPNSTLLVMTNPIKLLFFRTGPRWSPNILKRLKYDNVIYYISIFLASKGSCSLHVSGYNFRTDCQRPTLIPPVNSLSMLSISAGTGVGRGNVLNY